jgi:thioredoxin 1
MSTLAYITIAVIVLLAFLMIRRYRMFMSGVGTEESEKLVAFTDQNFKQHLKTKVVLVDFWAEWCQPCKIQGPIVSQVAADNEDDNVKVGKLDVEKNQKTAQQLGIRNIPTLIIFKNGKEFERLVGLKNKNVLNKAIAKALK